MKKVIGKGYTITVSSWENDGDLSSTKSVLFQELNDVKLTHKIIYDLFPTIGNSMDSEHSKFVVDYFIRNKDLLKFIAQNWTEEDWSVTKEEELSDMILDTFSEWSNELLGYSDVYDYRVVSEMSIVYSPEDIYLEEIDLINK